MRDALFVIYMCGILANGADLWCLPRHIDGGFSEHAATVVIGYFRHHGGNVLCSLQSGMSVVTNMSCVVFVWWSVLMDC